MTDLQNCCQNPFCLEQKDLLDLAFKRNPPVCDIPKTTKSKKKHPITWMRPPVGKYADYDLSETDTKLDAGPTKIHYRAIKVKYIPYTPEQYEAAFPKPKKVVHSHAGPPVWEFQDEKRKRKQDVLQEIYKEQIKLRVKARKRRERIQRQKAPWKYV